MTINARSDCMVLLSDFVVRVLDFVVRVSDFMVRVSDFVVRYSDSQVAWTAVPCDRCPCLMFCSKKCKLEAWKKYHHVECRILQRLSNKDSFDERIMMQYRSFIFWH